MAAKDTPSKDTPAPVADGEAPGAVPPVPDPPYVAPPPVGGMPFTSELTGDSLVISAEEGGTMPVALIEQAMNAPTAEEQAKADAEAMAAAPALVLPPGMTMTHTCSGCGTLFAESLAGVPCPNCGMK
jgi:hypothetical protein